MTEGAVRVAAHPRHEPLGALIREETALTVGDPCQIHDEIGNRFSARSL